MEGKDIRQTAGALLQSNKIIIETRDFDKYGVTWATDDVSILAIDCPAKELGEVLLKHLTSSSLAVQDREVFHHIRESYLRKTKFRTESALKKAARFVTIFVTDNALIFRSYENMISQGRHGSFISNGEDKIEINVLNKPVEIGRLLRIAWSKCSFN